MVPLLRLEVEVKNAQNLLQNLQWQNLKKGEDSGTISLTRIQKDKLKLDNLRGQGMKVVGMPDVRVSKWACDWEKDPSGQTRSQGLFPGLGAGREKVLASAGHVPTLHPEILGVIN